MRFWIMEASLISPFCRHKACSRFNASNICCVDCPYLTSPDTLTSTSRSCSGALLSAVSCSTLASVESAAPIAPTCCLTTHARSLACPLPKEVWKSTFHVTDLKHYNHHYHHHYHKPPLSQFHHYHNITTYPNNATITTTTLTTSPLSQNYHYHNHQYHNHHYYHCHSITTIKLSPLS